MNSRKSRYPFAPIRKGAFFFVTDGGLFYTVDISAGYEKFIGNDVLMNNGEVFEISFEKTGKETPRYDESIAVTILYILGSNMAAKGNTGVYYYVCDISGGDGKKRARLFDIWFLALKKDLPKLEKYNFIVPGFNEDEYDISLLIFNTHPNYHVYIDEFERCLNENFSKSNL